MPGNIGFAIEMDVSSRGESFHISGNQQLVLLSFSSIRSAVRLLRSNPAKRLKQHSILHRTSFETEIAGIRIAVSGHEIKPDLIARILGLRSTRFDLANLLRATFC
jgi:hypothetical protein